MDLLLDILKYTLPAALVVFAVYIVLRQLHNENEKHRRLRIFTYFIATDYTGQTSGLRTAHTLH